MPASQEGTVATRARRARGARSPLSREQIARVALAYLDRHGLEALSMRRLADELGVGTMTLYHYFRTKRELLDAVMDLAFAERELPAPEGDWRDQLREIATAARAVLSRHPGLVQVRVMQPILRPEALRFGELGLKVLQDAGFPPEEAAKAFRLLFTYTFGFAAFSPEATAEEAREAAMAAISDLPAEYYPKLSAAVEEAAAAMGGDAVFNYGLERILDGLEGRLVELR
jgi:AcrR family transcriptional regulator